VLIVNLKAKVNSF